MGFRQLAFDQGSVVSPAACVFGAPLLPGSLLVAWIAQREGIGAVFGLSGDPWTLVRRISTSAGDNWPCAMYWRLATAADGTTITVTSSSAAGHGASVAEYTGYSQFLAPASVGPSSGACSVTVVPGNGFDALLVAGASFRSDAGQVFVPVASFTGRLHATALPGLGPHMVYGDREVAPTAGGYLVGWSSPSGNRGVVAAAFQPPEPSVIRFPRRHW